MINPCLSLFTFALQIDATTEALLVRINDGRIYLTQTRHQGQSAIRVQVGAFDCTRGDVKEIAATVTRLLAA